MKTEHLISSNWDLDLEGRRQQQERQSTDETAPLGEIDAEHDAVYFDADSSPRSFSGHLSESLEDQEIIEYIRRTNRPLYDHLWGTLQNKPLQSVTPAITEQAEASDGARDASSPGCATKRLESEMDTASNASEKLSDCRSASIALPTSPDSISSFGSCSKDVLPTSSSLESPLRPSLSVSRSKKELQEDLFLLQQRRYIQSLLLNDHILVLQKVPPFEAKVRSNSCDHPHCNYRHGMPPGFYRFSLEPRRSLEKSTATTEKYHSPKSENRSRYLKVRSTNSRGFFCLTCIEDLFSGVGLVDDDYAPPESVQQSSSVSDNLLSTLVPLDGGSDENSGLRTIVLRAAEKLYPASRPLTAVYGQPLTNLKVETANTTIHDNSGSHVLIGLLKDASPSPLTTESSHEDLAGQSDLQFASNSDEALLLRVTRCQDTKETIRLLCQTSNRQEARQISQSSSNSRLPSLAISRPTDLPRPQERYKKQGLTEYNWRIYRRSLTATDLQVADASSKIVNMNKANSSRAVAAIQMACHCREPVDLKSMIRCGAEFCLIGLFHLKCSGLPRLPIKDETWFCKECSTLFGPGTFDLDLRLTPENDIVFTRVLRSTVRAASKIVGTFESGNEASDEPSTDDASLPLSDDEIRDPTYTVPMTPRRQSKSVVSMQFTPHEFLDGAGDGKPDVRSPATDEKTPMVNTGIQVLATSTKNEPKITKRSIQGIKRPSELSLEAPNERSTPAKRLKRISSPLPPLTPPSRHIKTSFGHLAPLIYPETRNSAAALSNPQIVALEKWKSIHLYSPLTEIIESPRSEAASLPSSKEKRQQPTAGPGVVVNIAAMELGGAVIDLPTVHGKKLSQILSEVDKMVEEELRKQGAPGWEQGVHAREEAVKIGKAKGSQIDEQNGVTSPKAANEIRRRISRSFSAGKE